MTTVLLLEDEAPARQRLEDALRRLRPDLVLAASLASVEQAVAWLAAHRAPDLVLADVQLADGLVFDVFERATVTCPVVFCTANDEYVTAAMGAGGIDYLLKPIRDAELARALERYQRLEAHFAERVREVGRALVRAPGRLLARKAGGFVTLTFDRIAYFVVDDRLVDAMTLDGRRLAVDRTLAELEAELDPAAWFRVNRQYLVAAVAVAGFRPWTKGKLLVQLAPAPPGDVVVSQENAARFRAWLGG